jgi:putrescine transport system substrate-binding protein
MDGQIGVMRKIITTIVAASVLLTLSGCGESVTGGGNDNVVNVYNWADYIDLDVIQQFEEEYGIKVNYDVYDTSEVVNAKLLAGRTGYDVVIHSNGFSRQLTPVGVYQKLDFSRFENLENLDPDIMQYVDLYGEVREYQIPYHWGTTGVSWNVDLVRERLPDQPMDTLAVLFDPDIVSKLADCGVSLLDSPSDVLPMVMTYLGIDPGSTDDASIAAAEEQLRLVRPYIRYFGNQKLFIDMPNKEICVAMSWAGDYATAMNRAAEAGLDIDLRYFVPKEGTPLWVDGIYIPSDAPHVDNAYKFIDFLLRADVSAAIVNEVNYANANRASWEFVDQSVLDNEAVFPPPEIMELIYVRDSTPPKRLRAYNRAYTRARSGI